MYSPSIKNLITALERLPSVGPRTAERYVFYLLNAGKRDTAELTLALKQLIERVKSCDICWDFSDESPCPICKDSKRRGETICVVAEPQDVHIFERTGVYDGTYHVLRGTLEPDDEGSVGHLKIIELLERVKQPKVKEIILAFNPDLNGETTMMFLERKIKATNPALTVSRLARGLPMGSDLQYADDITLGSALKHRVTSK